MRGVPRYHYIGLKNYLLSSVVAPRRRSTGASGGSLFPHPGSSTQGVLLMGLGPVS
jgi:hypothetical protein